MYCTYLTIYRGNKLPPFYLGYTSLANLERNYHGSVTSSTYAAIWREELRNNPQLFKTILLTLHNSKAEALEREEFFQTHFNVHKNPMYINMGIGGRHFVKSKMSDEEKRRLSERQRGKVYSQESRALMSERAKNRKPISDYTRALQSSQRKGIAKSESHRKKIGEAHLGMKRSEEAKSNISAACLNQPREACPHCGKVATRGNLTRWHGDKCPQRAKSTS